MYTGKKSAHFEPFCYLIVESVCFFLQLITLYGDRDRETTKNEEKRECQNHKMKTNDMFLALRDQWQNTIRFPFSCGFVRCLK